MGDVDAGWATGRHSKSKGTPGRLEVQAAFPIDILNELTSFFRTSEGNMTKDKSELLKGTLDMLILKALQLEPMHGYGLSVRLRQMSRDVFQVEMGSLYPALCRLELRGWVRAHWGLSENNRNARFYTLTSAGRKQLQEETAQWDVLSQTINLMLKTT